MSLARRVAGLALAPLAAVAPSAGRAAEPIPVATFVVHPDVSDVKPSPSGKFIALAIAKKSGRTILAESGVEMSMSPVVVASSGRADVGSFEWDNDDWLVFNEMDNRVHFYTRMETFLAKHIGH